MDHRITLLKEDLKKERAMLDEAMALLDRSQFWGEVKEERDDWQVRRIELFRKYHPEKKRR